jgi:SAM-dependent methyltransferase
VLDVGCGTGEHVLMSAGLGLDATGVDLASKALRAAEGKARDRGLTARFLLRDARELAGLGESFDTVLDCGLFHIFNDDDRAAYVDSLGSVAPPGSRYFMLCFSDQQPGDDWPQVHRVTQDEIRATFTDGWRVDSIEASTIDITTDPDGIRAWLVALSRRESEQVRSSGRRTGTRPASIRSGRAAHLPSPAGHLGTIAGFMRGRRRKNPVRQPSMMRSEARVPTPRGERYAKQLCSHAARMTPRAEWNPPQGVIEFPDAMGTCRMSAEPGQLVLSVEATDSASLARLQQIVGGNIERFANREGVKVEWVQD